MVLDRHEHKAVINLLSVRTAFKDGFCEDGYRYICTEGEDGTIACQFHVNRNSYSILYSTWTGVLEVDKDCDKVAEEFISYLRNKYFSIVGRDCISKHPEDVYFEIDGNIIRMDHNVPSLMWVYPNAAGDTMIWGGNVPWRN